MSVSEIKALSLHEKLQVMEIIWEDLRDRFESADISPQIKALLDVRRQRVQDGKSLLLDWDTVKTSVGRP